MIRDKKTSDKEEVLNTWRSHFSNLLNAGTTSPVSFPSCNSDYDTSCLNDPISKEEVKAAVTANINSKSPDQVKANCIKNESCVSFHKLFKYCFSLKWNCAIKLEQDKTNSQNL